MSKHKCDPVKMLTKKHGDVWICLECKKASKDVFTKEEIEVMIEFIKSVRRDSPGISEDDDDAKRGKRRRKRKRRRRVI